MGLGYARRMWEVPTNCDLKHETTSEKNLHRALAAELIRRLVIRTPPTRIAPGNIDSMADQLRESNHRSHGEQPIVTSKAWWGKTAGSMNPTTIPRKEIGRPDWESTKRRLDWEAWFVRAPAARNEISMTGSGRPMRRKPPYANPRGRVVRRWPSATLPAPSRNSIRYHEQTSEELNRQHAKYENTAILRLLAIRVIFSAAT